MRYADHIAIKSAYYNPYTKTCLIEVSRIKLQVNIKEDFILYKILNHKCFIISWASFHEFVKHKPTALKASPSFKYFCQI